MQYRSGYEQFISIERIIIHDDYDTDTLDNDIALLKLKTPIKYNSRVQPVCLSSSHLPADTECWVTGWGASEENGHNPAILQQAKIPLVSKQRCSHSYGNRWVTKSMLCAGYHTGEIDACGGDSGGPLVCSVNGKLHLMGVVSWGIGCGRPEYYGVYADIVHLKSWITNAMRYHMYF